MKRMSETTTVEVGLGARSYNIDIGHGTLNTLGRRLTPFSTRGHVAIVTDKNVAKHHLNAVEDSLTAAGMTHAVIIVEPGEASKSYGGLAKVCDGLLAAGVERNDLVLALGGGVIGDLAGFAAAILRRGVRFVQVPTTLLAQVDSSVGGKTGINSSHGKNLVGAFHQPQYVLIDLSLLETLPMRERRAGYAEVVKYGLLGNASFFEWLETRAGEVIAVKPGSIDHAVATSCQMKAKIVAEDETETGVRALLNLGHTFGHALEAATGYSNTLLHGEAVAIGMVQAFHFSAKLGHCDPILGSRVAKHLKAIGLPTHMRDIAFNWPKANELLQFMRQDKKAIGGKLTFILVKDIGEAFIAKDVPDNQVLDFLNEDFRRT
jgi:3-dehydroquinate synthase